MSFEANKVRLEASLRAAVVFWRQIQSFEQPSTKLSEVFDAFRLYKQLRALLFKCSAHPADKDVGRQRVRVFECCRYDRLPFLLSTCLQQRCTSLLWYLQWQFAQVSQQIRCFFT